MIPSADSCKCALKSGYVPFAEGRIRSEAQFNRRMKRLCRVSNAAPQKIEEDVYFSWQINKDSQFAI